MEDWRCSMRGGKDGKEGRHNICFEFFFKQYNSYTNGVRILPTPMASS